MTKKRSTDIRTCPVCGHPVQRSDMQFTRDCNGIPLIPTQEEMEKQKDLIKQLAEAGQEVAAGIEDLLKEMFNGE